MPAAIAADGARLWFTDHGAPPAHSGAPLLVLGHGFSADSGMWWPQIATLTACCRLVTWDARGHGRSQPGAAGSGARMEVHAADLRAVVAALDPPPAAPPVIGGMSFGGQIALQYAAEDPTAVGALVLSDVTTPPPAADGEPPAPPPPPPPAVAADPGLAAAWSAMITRPDPGGALARLTAPALVIYGTEDPMIAPAWRRLAERLPVRRVVALTGAQHGSSAWRPQAWGDVVAAFLDDVAGGRPITGEITR